MNLGRGRGSPHLTGCERGVTNCVPDRFISIIYLTSRGTTEPIRTSVPLLMSLMGGARVRGQGVSGFQRPLPPVLPLIPFAAPKTAPQGLPDHSQPLKQRHKVYLTSRGA